MDQLDPSAINEATGKREEEVGRHQRVAMPGVRQLPEGCGEQENIKRAGCKVVSGAPTILTAYGESTMK